VQKALPLMPDGSAIIVTSSIVGSKGLPNNSVYAATKAVARSFARTWTTDLKPRRIRVNAISPGSIDTPGLNGLLALAPAGEQRRKKRRSRRSGALARLTSLPRRRCFSPPTTRATSPGSNYLSMAASRKCELV
jgi:NAD(P)-dependent dehydrogenase (short-subunit alcohol dehydrogenase family)